MTACWFDRELAISRIGKVMSRVCSLFKDRMPAISANVKIMHLFVLAFSACVMSRSPNAKTGHYCNCSTVEKIDDNFAALLGQKLKKDNFRKSITGNLRPIS